MLQCNLIILNTFFFSAPNENIPYPADFPLSRKYLWFGFQCVLQWLPHRNVGISHRTAIPFYHQLPLPGYPLKKKKKKGTNISSKHFGKKIIFFQEREGHWELLEGKENQGRFFKLAHISTYQLPPNTGMRSTAHAGLPFALQL